MDSCVAVFSICSGLAAEQKHRLLHMSAGVFYCHSIFDFYLVQSPGPVCPPAAAFFYGWTDDHAGLVTQAPRHPRLSAWCNVLLPRTTARATLQPPSSSARSCSPKPMCSRSMSCFDRLGGVLPGAGGAVLPSGFPCRVVGRCREPGHEDESVPNNVDGRERPVNPGTCETANGARYLSSLRQQQAKTFYAPCTRRKTRDPASWNDEVPRRTNH
eukprot:365296-Chlamydomonas_euryale.AAC.22